MPSVAPLLSWPLTGVAMNARFGGHIKSILSRIWRFLRLAIWAGMQAEDGGGEEAGPFFLALLCSQQFFGRVVVFEHGGSSWSSCPQRPSLGDRSAVWRACWTGALLALLTDM